MNKNIKLVLLAAGAIGLYLYVTKSKALNSPFAANDYRVTGSYPSYTDTPQMNWSQNAPSDKSNVVYL